MNKYLNSYAPRVRVKIRDYYGTEKLDLSKDLIGIATNKAWGRAAGTWQLLLPYHFVTDSQGTKGRYTDLIQMDDFISIEMDGGDGKGYLPVMIGLVDRVAKTRQPGPIPHRQIKVSGLDLGKLLLKHDASWDIRSYNLQLPASGANQGNLPVQKQLSRAFSPQLAMGAPSELVKKLFDYTFRDVLPQWSKKFVFVSDTSDLMWKIHAPAAIEPKNGTSVWDLMMRYSHRPFNMLTTETGGLDSFNVIMEQQPLNDDGKLIRGQDRTHTIYEPEIVGEDVGVSDEERCTFLFYQPDHYLVAYNGSISVTMGHPDLCRFTPDGADIAQHGYRAKVVPDHFSPIEQENNQVPSQPGFWPPARKAADTLWAWYRNNHTYASGQFHLHLRPDIKAGDCLLYTDDGVLKQYLVEQVSHQANFAQSQFLTTLQVTRGQKHVG